MSRSRVGIAATILTAALAAGPAAGASAGVQASVRFLDLVPVTVRGAHFAPSEQVRVTVWAGTSKHVRTVQASAAGGFTVGFGTLARADRCSGTVAISAVGVRGDRAAFKLPPMMCPVASPGGGAA
jgi:hypothetical protein